VLLDDERDRACAGTEKPSSEAGMTGDAPADVVAADAAPTDAGPADAPERTTPPITMTLGT
jgi:hypothetical protein